MQILHLYKDYYPVIGGIENHIRWLAEAQAELGHEVTVLVCNKHLPTQTEWQDGVRVIRAGRLATLASMPISVRQPWKLAQQTPDIVHLHTPFPLGAVSNWFWGQAQATVITYHSDIVRQRHILRWYTPLLRRILQAADAIIATSPRYVESSPWLSPVRDRCRIVPLGIDPARFTPHSTSGTTLLFVGCLRYYKGIGTLLQAMTRLPDARLMIVGDGPMRTPWERQRDQLKLQSRVTFTGEVPDVQLPSLYAEADLFVLPANNRAEAFGTVLLEAMAAGLPVISTELGTGTSWVNQDERTGRVISPDDPEGLAETIRALLDRPKLRQRMGRVARERVKAEFDLTSMVHRIDEVYRSVLESQPAHIKVTAGSSEPVTAS